MSRKGEKVVNVCIVVHRCLRDRSNLKCCSGGGFSLLFLCWSAGACENCRALVYESLQGGGIWERWDLKFDFNQDKTAKCVAVLSGGWAPCVLFQHCLEHPCKYPKTLCLYWNRQQLRWSVWLTFARWRDHLKIHKSFWKCCTLSVGREDQWAFHPRTPEMHRFRCTNDSRCALFAMSTWLCVCFSSFFIWILLSASFFFFLVPNRATAGVHAPAARLCKHDHVCAQGLVQRHGVRSGGAGRHDHTARQTGGMNGPKLDTEEQFCWSVKWPQFFFFCHPLLPLYWLRWIASIVIMAHTICIASITRRVPLTVNWVFLFTQSDTRFVCWLAEP